MEDSHGDGVACYINLDTRIKMATRTRAEALQRLMLQHCRVNCPNQHLGTRQKTERYNPGAGGEMVLLFRVQVWQSGGSQGWRTSYFEDRGCCRNSRRVLEEPQKLWVM